MKEEIKKTEEEKIETNMEENKVEETKPTETKITEKKKEIKIVPKEKAVANGFSLKISQKDSKFICKAILGREIENAIKFLEGVLIKKNVIEMRGAGIPHRKGKGLSSGRYPYNASKEIIALLNQLKANAQVNSIGNPIISLAVSNKASEPQKKEGRRGKRTHIYLEAKEKKHIGGKK